MNVIRLHRKYLFNKINIIIIFLLCIISFLLAICLIKPFLDNYSRWMERFVISDNYEQSYLMFTKIILIMFTSYLFGQAFSKHGDNYAIILTCSISKNYYFVTKLIALASVSLLVTSVLFVNYVFVGMVFNKWYILSLKIIKAFSDLYLLSLVYGFISLSLVRLINSSYIIILSFGLYLVSEILLEYDASLLVVKVLTFFLPTTYLNSKGISLLYGSLHLVILNIFYLLLSYCAYLKKE